LLAVLLRGLLLLVLPVVVVRREGRRFAGAAAAAAGASGAAASPAAAAATTTTGLGVVVIAAAAAGVAARPPSKACIVDLRSHEWALFVCFCLCWGRESGVGVGVGASRSALATAVIGSGACAWSSLRRGSGRAQCDPSMAWRWDGRRVTMRRGRTHENEGSGVKGVMGLLLLVLLRAASIRAQLESAEQGGVDPGAQVVWFGGGRRWRF
jgi:hypothetical protein